MVSTLQIVNPDDTTQVLFDLNDTSGTNSALYGSVQTDLMSDVDLGSAKAESNADTSALAFNRSASADMHFRLRMRGTSYDNMNKAIGVLSYYLSRGCVMKWIPNGSSKTSYIDVLPSPTPVLLHGQELALYQATQLFDSPEGAELQIKRLGYIRRAGLTAASNLLVNPTLLRDSDGNGLPDSWTQLGGVTMTIAAATESFHAVCSAGGQGIYQRTGAATASVGQVWTFSCEARVSSGNQLALFLYWYSAVPAVIGSPITTTLSVASNWTRLTLTGTAPATTDRIEVYFLSSGGATTFDVRNAQLELSSSATDFRVPGALMQVDPAATGFAQLMPIYNPSEAPAPCEVLVAFPDSSSKIVEVDYGLVSDKSIPGSRALSDFLNGPNYLQAESTAGGWTITLSGDTTSTADANASGGNVARIAHTTDPTQAALRIRASRTTTLDSLRGRFKVYARVKAAAIREYNMQLRWGAGTVAGESNDAVTHDTTNLPATGTLHYVYIDLGNIELPLERNITIGQLTLELWTWQTSGAASNLDVDHFILAPTDDSAIATIPPGAQVSVLGKSLTTPPKQLGAPTSDPAWSAGSVAGDAMRMNAANEAVGWGSNTNGFYTGTANTVRVFLFDINIHVGAAGGGLFGSVEYYAQIANITDNTLIDATSATMSIGYIRSSSYRHTIVLISQDVAAKKYQPRVYIAARTSPSFLEVNSIAMYTLPMIGQNGKLRSDPGSLPSRAAVEQVDSSGNLGLTADSTGTPFWIPPGLSLLWVNCFDVPTVGYNENKSDLTSGAKRTMTVTPTVYPRYWT